MVVRGPNGLRCVKERLSLEGERKSKEEKDHVR